MIYEYKVVPAPKRAEKVKGLKTTEDRYAHALQELMNQQGRDGWEYQRAETLPVEERSGFRSKGMVEQHMLVFRREKKAVDTAVTPSQTAVPAQPVLTTAPKTPAPTEPTVAAQ